ncbi:MAG TPA: hypothetical protein DDY37_04380 [Legionella sp.]|nr:hypothetical protein [Legionella sp.]
MRKTALVLLCCVSYVLHAAHLSSLKITGITGDPLLNVQHRLSELYTDQSIHQESLDTLRSQVAKALYPYGYFKPDISVYAGSARQTIFIQVVLGDRLLITTFTHQVSGEGADNAEIQQTLRELPLHVGDPFNSMLYEEAKDQLLSAAEHQGYLHASFETSKVIIDKARYTANVILLLHTGPQYYFGPIRFNKTSISPELLHRYVPFKYGQPYSTGQILDLNRNLVGSGYFNAVNVSPAINAASHVPIDVSLVPVKRINYSVGAGYGTDTGPRGRLGLSVIPVNHAGHTFNAVALGSFQENALEAQYSIPGANPVTDHYRFNGGFSNLSYNAGHSNAVLLGVAQQHVLTHFQRILSLNALHERYNYTFTGFSTEEETLLYPKGVFTWSKTTDPLFSPSGYNVTLNGLGASSALLSQINLAQVSINAKGAYTMDSMRTRFYVHAIQGFSAIHDINHLPLSLALLLGGAENLKGYSFNSIGPGKVLSYAGIQIQKETAHHLFLLGFYDVGDVYDPMNAQTKYDAGIGIMWVSPVGPIKVEVAQAINQRGQRIPDHSPKLVINMGPDL